jgi:D-tyrosyl-tRNA(Tyr) deacylase
MRLLIQRVKRASVTVEHTVVGSIAQGLLAFVGIAQSDTQVEMEWMCNKLLNLRIFADDEGKMNRSVKDVQGGILLVSQFTLYGDAHKGFRPSFIEAAHPSHAEPLYNAMLARLRSDYTAEAGVFGAMMDVELVNDGPVTIWIEKHNTY